VPTFSALPPTPDTTGNFDAMGMPTGEGAQQIREIKPAGQIVRDLMHEARSIIDRRLASSPA